ncbi:guanylate kinase [Actinomadura craniellae]|uniref:Guanylate kinase n=1 Tax=Actinomadura craniellae TaxID=2231787 RepID=A0A365HA85_9ACTN|nr:guanylate kinase [Actinomadura craniellae]RAY15939.1 guanylate kinase [Actinomadura craniellae]
MRGVILYGPPAAGKDTLTAALGGVRAEYRPVVKVKVGSGNDRGYRMATARELAELRRDGRIVQQHSRYGNTYAVDRVEVEGVWAAGGIPVLHTGRLADLRTLRGGLAAPFLSVLLWCDRDTTARRSAGRGDADTGWRLSVWDETAAELARSGPGDFDLAIRTDRTAPGHAARLIDRAVSARAGDPAAVAALVEEITRSG